MSLVRHEVDPCPRCGARHRFVIELAEREQETVLFGGPGDQDDAVEVGLTCPVSDELFTDRVSIPPGARFKRVVTSGGAAGAGPPVSEGSQTSEFEDWVRGSRTVATDFCRTMLTTASGAIPVYFAVLKYLGTERLEGSLGSKASILPPVLFLGAIVLFALALRPEITTITESGFAAYREQRLRRLNRFIGWGVVAFAAGIAVSLGVFIRALATV